MEIKSRVKKTFEKLLNSKFFKLSNKINNNVKQKGKEHEHIRKSKKSSCRAVER